MSDQPHKVLAEIGINAESPEQQAKAINAVDRGLWRLFNLAEIGEISAREESTDVGALAHLLEQIKENARVLHELTQTVRFGDRV